MMYGILFALLGLCLACFREGVWTQFTPQDIARWQAEGQAARAHPVAAPLPLLGPINPKAVRPPATPQPRAEAWDLVA